MALWVATDIMVPKRLWVSYSRSPLACLMLVCDEGEEGVRYQERAGVLTKAVLLERAPCALLISYGGLSRSLLLS